MRLLKTGPYVPGHEKLELAQKWGRDIPPYAILSHTWSRNPDDEVLLEDILNGTCVNKAAYSKVVNAMERARLDGYGWMWIDNCCIDKTSSVELSEAINSMYTYYMQSEKCYAYLADVNADNWEEEFRSSRWWTRGFTLQELLAPWKVEFFNSDWKPLGYKDHLHQAITGITGIEHEYLVKKSPVTYASVAKRMSWASTRRTTRDEDMAYCLIGIFDVNMPMLYGEGAVRAFHRLQEEIMKSNEDQSLFAWITDSEVPGSEAPQSYHGMLADSPMDFARTGMTIPYTDSGDYVPSTLTARGLNISLPLIQKPDGVVVAALQCTSSELGFNGWLAVYLQHLPLGNNQYARIDCTKLASVSEPGRPQELYVRQNFATFGAQTIYPYHFFQIRSIRPVSYYEGLAEYKIVSCSRSGRVPSFVPRAPPQRWSRVPLTYQINKNAGSLATALLIQRTLDQQGFTLMLGTSSDSNIGVTIIENEFESHANMQKAFNPQPPGAYVKLECHRVRVSIEEHVRTDHKMYFVDIEIIGLPLPPTAIEMLQGVSDIITNPHRRAPKVEFWDKWRRFRS